MAGLEAQDTPSSGWRDANKAAFKSNQRAIGILYDLREEDVALLEFLAPLLPSWKQSLNDVQSDCPLG
jgi:hypothetical protein